MHDTRQCVVRRAAADLWSRNGHEMKLYDVAFSMIVVLHYRGLRAACWLWGRGLPL